jgi:hypothetical protein
MIRSRRARPERPAQSDDVGERADASDGSLIECFWRRLHRVGSFEVAEVEARALTEVGHGYLEDLELLEAKRLELGLEVILGEHEGLGGQGSVFDVRDDLSERSRHEHVAVAEVVGLEDRPTDRADPQVVDVGVGEDRILEPSPDAAF